jgi:hypothetical protein
MTHTATIPRIGKIIDAIPSASIPRKRLRFLNIDIKDPIKANRAIPAIPKS